MVKQFEKMDIEAIRQEPSYFQQLPNERKTNQVCMAGVQASGYNLEFVPEGMKTEEMCRQALKASPDLGFEHAEILAHVPYPAVCLEAMKEFSDHVDCVDLIRNLRKEVINEDIAMFAVTQDGNCLAAIPLHLQNDALACQATITSGNSVLASRNIREDIKTENAYKCGLNEELFQSFLFIPKEKRTPDHCLTAWKWFPEQIAKRPEEIPDHVRSGCNVFSLNAKMEQCTGSKFEFCQMENFYNGTPLKVKSIQTPKGELKDTMVKFDKEKQEFTFSPAKQEKKNRLKI